MSDELERLAAEFPPEALGTLPKAGGLTYVPVHEVIQRLNDVLGWGGWAWECGPIMRDREDPTWFITQGTLTVLVGTDSWTRFSGSGGGQTSGGLDVEDAMKAAESNALKKAAQRVGVGLYLSRGDDAVAATAEANDWPTRDADIQALIGEIKAAPETVQTAVREWRDGYKISTMRMTRADYDSMRQEFERTLTKHDTEEPF